MLHSRTLVGEFGRHRSLLVGLDYQMVPSDNVIFVTTGAHPPTDPSISRSGGIAPTWYWGDGDSDTGDSVTHNYASAGSYSVTWNAEPSSIVSLTVQGDDITSINTSDKWTIMTVFYCPQNSLTSLETYAEWTSILDFRCFSNNLTSLETHSEWTDLQQLRCYSNSLTSLETHSEWTDLSNFQCNVNSLTSLETHSEWTNLITFYCYINSLTSLETHSEWTNLTTLRCNSNSITDIVCHSTWTSINTVHVHLNQLTIASIDAFLIALDATGASNGTLKYENNPGSADVDRSPAAATAKANLVTKGWTITN